MPRQPIEPGDFDLVVRRSHSGLGLFANQAIPRGSCVIEYTGTPITGDQQTTSRSRYLFEITATKWIDGAPRSNRARYINHSCKPNCEIFIRRGRIFVHARRNIKPGEELNYDYGKEYVDAFIGEGCRCNSCAPELAPAAKTVAKSPAKARAKPAREARA